VTNEPHRQPDDAFVDALLGSTKDSDQLRAALLDLRALGSGPAPAASPELLAAMSDNVTSIGSHRARAALAIGLGAVVAVTVGVGSAAAAIPEFREAAVTTLTTIVNTVTGTHNDDEPDVDNDGSPDPGEKPGTGQKPGTVTPGTTETNGPPGADNFPNPSNTHAPDSNPGKGPGGKSGTHGNSGGSSDKHPNPKPTKKP
jgi:hypothetical protein